ncbi:MAG: PIN domain-containing protein [Anaerolineae bacterium]|nr:PIN domain-containing protein [Anaerolineae bacterium]MCO5188277.1 PIN domain-containing protein [Anaerolineae bacterium]MCO5195243.1 PIN domain-containing protein [Anaerolineae bacterium]MCO5197888.1 PIN domain-containing protein [Anaerolineae bacterium]MCO5203469.1 PIN domain-containing protein [Anaerolineae bacterium]
MIYLDTHVIVWLYAGLIDKLSENAKTLISANELLMSPIVRLELQYLYEIGRITATSDAISADLSRRIGLAECSKPFPAIISHATQLTWTRDPFDRIIAAHAELNGNLLLTKDQTMLNNVALAQW